jgi:hypothetical protein
MTGGKVGISISLRLFDTTLGGAFRKCFIGKFWSGSQKLCTNGNYGQSVALADQVLSLTLSAAFVSLPEPNSFHLIYKTRLIQTQAKTEDSLVS